MANAVNTVILLTSVIFPPFLVILLISLVLASVGLTLGIRQKYIDALLKLFEYGRIKIAKAEKRKKSLEKSKECVVDSEDGLVSNSEVAVISRDNSFRLVPEPEIQKDEVHQEQEKEPADFKFDDALDFLKAGVEAIIEDEVTKRFSAEELQSWNLLTRTNKNYHYISMRLTVIWFIGFFFRYCVLLPTRLFLTAFGVGWLCVCTAVIGYLPDGKFKRWLNWNASLMCFRILSRAFSAIIKYHNKENRAKGGGICVANHTSPIDVVILACDSCYSLIGQSHGGFLGILQRALARASSHIWFERSEVKDRSAVTNRMRKHVEDIQKHPILIFPEGTCINNTSVMMFKKGSFEIGGLVYPVAIKYDPRFGDPFWDSSKQTMTQYLLMMMTSWAIVCDVWYLPPMKRDEGEDAVDFANRVKSEIAKQGGLVDLVWDGQLKRMTVKKEWKEKQQAAYSQRIKLE